MGAWVARSHSAESFSTALADAAIALLNDPAEWNRASQAAIARVERYYTDSMMFGSYRKVYQKALGGPATDEAR